MENKPAMSEGITEIEYTQPKKETKYPQDAAFDFVASAIGWCFFLRRCPMAPVTNTWDTQVWVQL